MGFNQYGLYHDDALYEHADVAEAVRRLPPQLQVRNDGILGDAARDDLAFKVNVWGRPTIDSDLFLCLNQD